MAASPRSVPGGEAPRAGLTTALPSTHGLSRQQGAHAKQSCRAAAFGATQMSHRQGGESPPRAHALRPETERNCWVARPGGEHLEVNTRPATQVNSIRSASQRRAFRSVAKPRPSKRGKPVALRGSVQKRRRGLVDDWRQDGRKAMRRNGESPAAGQVERPGTRGFTSDEAP